MFNYREAGRTNQYSHHKSSPSLLRERARYNKTLCTSAEITEGRINISNLHALSGKYRIMFVHVRIASIVNKLSVQRVRVCIVNSPLEVSAPCLTMAVHLAFAQGHLNSATRHAASYQPRPEPPSRTHVRLRLLRARPAGHVSQSIAEGRLRYLLQGVRDPVEIHDGRPAPRLSATGGAR